ncbi:MAG: ABC transporter ATP-binding protein [Burkholderiaceae bacterium]|jgi:ABC-type iron transport system FetAB ATPase subunit|nr:ABC transporter ATP-binding protein [Burkholderiaceae bacterium]
MNIASAGSTYASDPPMPRLRVRDLRSPHGGPYGLDLEAGECLAVLGPSGSGKSVLLRLIADLDPHQGEVWLDGRSRSTWPAPEWRRQVVYQAAEPAWWAPTAEEHLGGAAPAVVAPMLEQLGLRTAMLAADISRLSTGERQRMALVRSLARAPRVLLLDEPTASLDGASTQAVEQLLGHHMRQGLAVICVTHSEEQARRIAGRSLRIGAQAARSPQSASSARPPP